MARRAAQIGRDNRAHTAVGDRAVYRAGTASKIVITVAARARGPRSTAGAVRHATRTCTSGEVFPGITAEAVRRRGAG